jgi:hypothetical protein
VDSKQGEYAVGSLQFSLLLVIQPSDGCIANRLLRPPAADEWQTVCGRTADCLRIIRRPNFSLTEICYFSCPEMRYETRDFGAHLSPPEMLGVGHTFFCTETVSFG